MPIFKVRYSNRNGVSRIERMRRLARLIAARLKGMRRRRAHQFPREWFRREEE